MNIYPLYHLEESCQGLSFLEAEESEKSVKTKEAGTKTFQEAEKTEKANPA